MTMTAAILAGGLSKRLRPMTDHVPKALIPVAGRPFIEHQLRLLSSRGISRVVLCVGHLGKMIRDVVGNGNRFGLDVEFAFDGPRLLGTAGALKNALPLLGNSFFVLYGDSYLDIDYLDVQKRFLQAGKLGLMTICRNGNRWDRSNVLLRGGRIMRYDKKTPTPDMKHIDYGLAVLSSSALDLMPAGRCYDLADVYGELVKKGELSAYEVIHRFYEIGSRRGVRETERYLSRKGSPELSHSFLYLREAGRIIEQLNGEVIEQMVRLIVNLRSRGGRLFILGVGGGAGNATHAVNDFRKLAGIESYAPTDNVSELTARVNDEGWETVFVEWLKISRLSKKDMIFVLSVGGGNIEHRVSPNLVSALQYSKKVGAKIIGIVGRDGGYTAKVADVCVMIPIVNASTVTPHTEAFQSLILHLLVSHPLLQLKMAKWESVR